MGCGGGHHEQIALAILQWGRMEPRLVQRAGDDSYIGRWKGVDDFGTSVLRDREHNLGAGHRRRNLETPVKVAQPASEIGLAKVFQQYGVV